MGERQDRPRVTSRTCADGLHRPHSKGRPGTAPDAIVAVRRAVNDDGNDTAPRVAPTERSAPRAVEAKEGRGQRELRPGGGKSRWCPLYRQIGPETFVILAVAPEVQTDQAGCNRTVRHALERFAELEI